MEKRSTLETIEEQNLGCRARFKITGVGTGVNSPWAGHLTL